MIEHQAEFLNSQPEARNVLTLTHFELRVLLVDNEQTTLTTNDLAVGCTLL